MGICQSSSGAGSRRDPYEIPKPSYYPTQPRPTPQHHSTQPTPPISPHTSSIERPPPPPPPPPPIDSPVSPTPEHHRYVPSINTPSVPGAHHVSGPAPSVPFSKTEPTIHSTSRQTREQTGVRHGVPYTGLPRPSPFDNSHPVLPSPAPAVLERCDGFDEKYTRGKELGFGAFAKVFIGVEKTSGEKYAVKLVDRKKMQWGDRDALHDEIENLRDLKEGPHIVQLFEVYTPNKRECYLVMELLQGGELFDRILEKRTFTEKEARNVTRGLLQALSYMHSRSIAHRDLKPENLLLVVSLRIRAVIEVVGRFKQQEE